MASTDSVREDFLSRVERVRREIQIKFQNVKMILQEREADLLAELQRLVDEYTGEGIVLQIKQLSKTKDNLKDNLKGNENQVTLKQTLAPLDARIAALESKLKTAKDTYKSVSLEWDVELEKKLSMAGDVRLNAVRDGIRDYKEIEDPVAVFGKHSLETSSPGVFCYPGGIAINPETNNIYVCDQGYNRVQVFSASGDFLFLFNEKMDGPVGICVNRDKVYVVQYQSCCLNVY